MPDVTQVSGSSSVSRETLERLTAFAKLLTEWNKTINLVAPSTLAQLWARHIDDSLKLMPYLADSEHGVDLGSGAGFPGLILSIASGIPYTLIEADHRKASFLREAIRLTNAPAKVHVGRVEEFSLATFSLITARAFAPLSQLLSISRHLLGPGSRYLLLKSGNLENELATAAEFHCFSALQHPEAGVLEISLVKDRSS